MPSCRLEEMPERAPRMQFRSAESMAQSRLAAAAVKSPDEREKRKYNKKMACEAEIRRETAAIKKGSCIGVGTVVS